MTAAWRYFRKNHMFYILLLPGMFYYILFRYIPLGGIVIAFKKYNIFKGVWGSPWVGWDNFTYLFNLPEFTQALWNSVAFNVYSLVFGFPAPIILALFLNEIRKIMFKRVIQTVIYMPHFLSWVVVSGIVIGLLSPTTGLVNTIIEFMGGEVTYFATEPDYIRTIIIGSGVWKGVGWGTIIYLAALTTVDPQLYEAATVDGANRFRQAWHITIPAIVPTATILFLLNIGNLLEFGFEQVYVFMNPLVYSKGDILETYVYRVGIEGGQYSLATAVGLFQNIFGLLLLILANQFVKRKSDHSLF